MFVIKPGYENMVSWGKKWCLWGKTKKQKQKEALITWGSEVVSFPRKGLCLIMHVCGSQTLFWAWKWMSWVLMQVCKIAYGDVLPSCLIIIVFSPPCRKTAYVAKRKYVVGETWGS